jgi:hypothetical protein
MTKKGPVSEAEAFYILHHLDMHPRAIGKKIGRSFEVVSDFIASQSKSNLYKHKNKIKSKRQREEEEKASKQTVTNILPEEPKETLLSKQFARREEGGTIVMTPNASIMADEKRSKFKGKKMSSSCTTIKRESGNGQ